MLALAGELRLTEKQRLFAEALMADPERNQTKAAEAAGLGTPYHVQGSKMVRVGKVQQYMAAIDAMAGLTEGKGEATESKIASRQEVLELMTAHARADPDDFLDEFGSFSLSKAREAKKTKLLREITVDEKVINVEGEQHVLERKTKFKVVDQQKALDQLARHHKIFEEGGQGGREGTLGDLVRAMDAATRLAMAKLMLRGQNGNGHVVEGERVG